MKTISCDVAIIGSSFGGAGCAYALSRAGLDVVVVERGGEVARDDRDWDPRRILIDKRYKSDTPIEIDQYSDKAPSLDYPNEVVGGNSVFYGGAALRLRENDFARWPLSYGDLAPYYDQAEAIQEVAGEAGVDPFEPPREGAFPRPANPLTPAASRMADAARSLDLTPFRIPMAIRFHHEEDRQTCINCFTCDGFPCKIGAKNDAPMALLAKADRSRLRVLARTVATRLDAGDGRVKTLHCVGKDHEQELSIKATVFIVAAGAVHSPAILLRSGLDRFDRSGRIGRYLMRHVNGMLGGVFPFPVNPEGTNHKQICISDQYEDVRSQYGTAVGIIQDMCMPPRDAVRHLAPAGFRQLAATFSDYIQAVICIGEDRPQWENRVTIGNTMDDYGLERLHIRHRYQPDDYLRRDMLIHRARRVLDQSGAIITKIRPVDSFSHAVGSVRFGTDPTRAPLDIHCKLNGLENAYVVDGSFFPSSAGVNPSLTILANALRVSEHIAGQW